jgi:hypothetical protein
MNTFNLTLPTWDEGNTEPNLVFNALLLAMDALVQFTPEAITASPPGSPTDGQAWIIAASPTGVWVGKAQQVAIAMGGNWIYYAPTEGWMGYVKNLDSNYQFDGSTWNAFSGGGGGSSHPIAIQLAVSDETTAITTGTSKLTFRLPYAFTLTGVRASLTTASSSGIPTVDINMNGASILSTKLTIDATEKTSTTAATAAVISTAAMTDDAEITIDIDVAGTGATGLKVALIGTKT